MWSLWVVWILSVAGAVDHTGSLSRDTWQHVMSFTPTSDLGRLAMTDRRIRGLSTELLKERKDMVMESWEPEYEVLLAALQDSSGDPEIADAVLLHLDFGLRVGSEAVVQKAVRFLVWDFVGLRHHAGINGELVAVLLFHGRGLLFSADVWIPSEREVAQSETATSTFSHFAVEVRVTMFIEELWDRVPWEPEVFEHVVQGGFYFPPAYVEEPLIEYVTDMQQRLPTEYEGVNDLVHELFDMVNKPAITLVEFDKTLKKLWQAGLQAFHFETEAHAIQFTVLMRLTRQLMQKRGLHIEPEREPEPEPELVEPI